MKMKFLCLLFPLLLSFQSGDGLKEEIGRFLNKRLSGYEKIDFEISSKPITQADEVIKVDTLKDLKVNGSTAYIPVILMSRDKKTSQSFLSLKLSLYKKVLVAKGLLKAGSELKAEDFELRTVDLAKLRGEAVSDPISLMGQRSRLVIREGEALTTEKLQPLPAVKRGDQVKAYAVKGNVEISMDAVARQDGCTGEVIRITTRDKKIFRAKVIDQYSVNIVE